MERKRYVILTAGGIGSRMQASIPKQMLKIGGKPILRHTIEAFLNLPFDIGFVLVINSTVRDLWKKYCAENDFMKFPYVLTNGGISRFHSVKNALEYIPKNSIVAVHDAVRPFVSQKMLIEMFKAAEDYEAVIPQISSIDSMRFIDNKPKVVLEEEGPHDWKSYDGKGDKNIKDPGYKIDEMETHIVDRSRFIRIQTPQIFHSEILLDSYTQPYSVEFTDDASVVEKKGYKLTFVKGDSLNIKITTSEDLKLSEILLNYRKNNSNY